MRVSGGLKTLPRWLLWVLVPMQALCSGFFIWDIAVGVFGLRSQPISWQYRELIEIGAAIGLVSGFGIGLAALVLTLRRNEAMEGQIRAASAAFAELLDERFTGWGLTPAERDVAWFTLKGCTIAEIAALRSTSEGTVKAQSNAIYRKAGVAGRAQLVSLFIEDLMEARPGPDAG
ncbi:helix-turn-helix transcriptional regulator [Halovulum dunhuangense]|uniref:Helix-turn-helix transcriptional regulator n=1 Tax=Halovulum dunhuangense TaxID=1505036 RepID=A0A849KW69_9RHOB|nr:LuxR C-terminal-related transcriptional regulator [Halovulum dunhuangense]NNU79425.1 helix-turn-helix transcriptional regulator [Halovulum dunhuangense]